MPLYEYLCQNCGHQFERIQKFSDAPIAECPKCGGPVQKLVSSPAFHLKGTGWYATDYARSGQGDKSTSADSKSSGKSDSAGTKDAKDTKDTESKTAKESTSSETKDTKPSTTEPKAKT